MELIFVVGGSGRKTRVVAVFLDAEIFGRARVCSTYINKFE